MPMIDLPDDLVDRVRRCMEQTPGKSDADVIRDALDSLERQRTELAAIEAGHEAMLSGRVRPYEQFSEEFRRRHGIEGDDSAC